MDGKTGCRGYDVLLVEDDPADALAVQQLLGGTPRATEACSGLFDVTHVARLAPALNLLATGRFSAVLLEVQLPEVEGLESLLQVRSAAPDVAVIVLTRIDDDRLALEAIRQGAQEYLVKDYLEWRSLIRTIRHAVERKRREIKLRRQARQARAARTRIEQQAAQLSARTEHLDRVNRSLDDFTYIASHDLKEPLRGISAYCEVLLEDYEDKLDRDGRRRLEAMVGLCDRLSTLIDKLLTYCRVGQSRPPDVEVNLNAVVEEVLRSLRPAIDHRGASVSVAGRLPMARGDATLLSMVFSNLISNGLKFNDSRQPHVVIGSVAGDPPAVYVRDNGIGIAAEHHEAIFNIFRRLHSQKEYEGSGAGLTIVRKIVESHGGTIWLESELGRGTTFFFTLVPLKTERPGQPPHWLKRASAADTSKRSKRQQ